jgi:hypothetical protein
VPIPDEQLDLTEEYNKFLIENLADQKILPHLPEFWSFHDSWRFADAAGYNKENMLRDAIDHSPWIESQKEFSLSPSAAEILTSGNLYVHGRDLNGYPNIIFRIKGADTSEANIPNYQQALIFLTAVVKKFMLLPYYCELFNVIIDIGNTSVWGLPRKFISALTGIHQ